MTAQIADAIDEALKPRGVAVMLEAEHMCMSMRGVQEARRIHHHHAVHRPLPDDPAEQVRFLTLVRRGGLSAGMPDNCEPAGRAFTDREEAES